MKTPTLIFLLTLVLFGIPTIASAEWWQLEAITSDPAGFSQLVVWEGPDLRSCQAAGTTYYQQITRTIVRFAPGEYGQCTGLSDGDMCKKIHIRTNAPGELVFLINWSGKPDGELKTVRHTWLCRQIR
ncbi:MAG: hypothetical protein AAB037_05970 [Chloroflexota bacterium]